MSNKTPDREDVRLALVDLRDAGGPDAVKKVLDTAGNGHQLSSLPEDLFQAVIRAAKGRPSIGSSDDGFSKIGRALNAAAKARYAGRSKPRA